MMTWRFSLLNKLLLLLPLGWLAGCVEPYAPAVISAPPSLLVVDGFLNARGVSTIHLSRTTALDVKTAPPVEIRANLFIEAQNGGPRYVLTETAPGTYTSAALTLEAGRAYRLRITTAKGQQYASDFSPVKLAPPLDAVRWQPENNGVSVLVSTHDDARDSQYYRWEYDETWQIRTLVQPKIEFFNGRLILIRSPYPYPDFCWSSAVSNRILLSQSTALAKDRIANFQLLSLPPNSTRLYIRYSLLVRQQALSKEEYAYWDLLRKNTENIGSLFDAQPTQLTGNVHSLDEAGESALGFVGVHSVSEKSLFIDRDELPDSVRPLSGYEACLPLEVIDFTQYAPPLKVSEKIDVLLNAFNDRTLLPIDFEGSLTNPDKVIYQSRDCIDCRTRGTAVRPSFW